jgi:anti-sigma factor RsiW
MACEDVAPLLDASLDGELDAVHALELERHLAACPACASELARLRALRAAIRGRATRHRLPPAAHAAVRRRLRETVRAGAPAAAAGGISRRVLGSGMAASLLLGLVLGSRFGPRLVGANGGQDLAAALVAAHIRSLEPGHGIDVPSSDQHTVKPWFDGRVAFSPPVKDLSEAGFALIGGRRDYVDHHEAAVLVYRRREHRIDLFVWPAAGDRPALLAATSDGYHLRLWTEGGFALAAVSNLNPVELDEFVRRWRAA